MRLATTTPKPAHDMPRERGPEKERLERSVANRAQVGVHGHHSLYRRTEERHETLERKNLKCSYHLAVSALLVNGYPWSQ